MKKLIANKENPNGIYVDLSEEELNQHTADREEWDNGAFDRAILDLRNKRNVLLSETDWMANSDVTMSDDWKTYRQQLRDLPSGLDTVEKVDEKLKMEDGKFINFPTKPSGE